MPKDPPVTKEHAKKAIASKKAFDDHWFTRHVMKMTPQQREQTRQLMDEVDNVEFEKRIRNKNVLSRTYALGEWMLAKVLNMAWDLKYYLVTITGGCRDLLCVHGRQLGAAPDAPVRLVGQNKKCNVDRLGMRQGARCRRNHQNTADAFVKNDLCCYRKCFRVPNFLPGRAFQKGVSPSQPPRLAGS